MILRIILTAVTFLLLGAHFLRAGHPVMMAICLLLPLLFLVKKRWILVVLQALAYVAAIVWIRTAVQIVNERMLHGMKYRGVILILGTVALFSIVSGLLLNSSVMKRRYEAKL